MIKTKESDQKREEQKNTAQEESDYDQDELEPQEFIFLIDRSGSMYFGNKAIIMAKKAL